jgi:two-component system chemotaxis response regulator CheY
MIAILVVDDEPTNARLFRQRFRHEIKSGELEFNFAISGKEGLELFYLNDQQYDFILTDINMPGMNGLEFLQEIRKSNKTVPVYVLSAYENNQYNEQALSLGATGFPHQTADFFRSSRYHR